MNTMNPNNSHDDSNKFGRGIVERAGELASGEDCMPATAYCRIAPEEPTAPGSIRKQKNVIHHGLVRRFAREFKTDDAQCAESPRGRGETTPTNQSNPVLETWTHVDLSVPIV
jgi:hypothetical protein